MYVISNATDVDVYRDNGTTSVLCPKDCPRTFACCGSYFYLHVEERNGSGVSFENPGHARFHYSNKCTNVTMDNHIFNDGRKIVCRIGTEVPENYTVHVEVSDCYMYNSATTTIGTEGQIINGNYVICTNNYKCM